MQVNLGAEHAGLSMEIWAAEKVGKKSRSHRNLVTKRRLRQKEQENRQQIQNSLWNNNKA